MSAGALRPAMKSARPTWAWRDALSTPSASAATIHPVRDFRLRTDLKRAVINGFALPLGIDPGADLSRFKAPFQGYTVTYTPAQDDEPDTYAFHVVVSHEKLAPIIHKVFELLPEEVYGIIEIGSRDAYRSTDVYIGQEAVPADHFVSVWKTYEQFLLEDGSLAAGANSEDPFIEIFLDQWKGLSMHVPADMQERVEAMLHGFGVEEVPQTWPAAESDDELGEGTLVRPVLELVDEYSPDVDELLLTLRHEWSLELNIDPESNVDDGGRSLGTTLWHAVVIVEEATPNGQATAEKRPTRPHGKNDPPRGAYASIWATAKSLSEMERLIEEALDEHPQWAFGEIYTVDRVAFDERPDQLADLRPGRREPQVHLVTFEPWDEPPPKRDDMMSG